MTDAEAWQRELPESWEVLPLKAVASCVVSSVDKLSEADETPVRLCNYREVYNHEFIRPDMDFMRATATLSEAEKFRLVAGDVVITKDSESWDDIGVPALVVETIPDLVCGYHLAILRADRGKLHGRFLLRCLQSKLLRLPLELASLGVTRFGLPKDAIARLPVPIPPLAQQASIAARLDRETAEIDELVAEKEEMLRILEEKRRALIALAVTRGTRSTAKMKTVGEEWLRAMPQHWELKRGKNLFTQSRLDVRDDDEIVTCFRDGQVTLRKHRRLEGFTYAVKEVGYQGIRAGQLVLHSMDAFAGAIGVSDSDGKCTPEYIVCDPVADDVSPQYFGHLLRVVALRGFIQAACPAVRERAPRIRYSDLAQMFLPVPPYDEQLQIVQTIRENQTELQETCGVLADSLRLLAERRTALITAAVTGKIDVDAMN